MLRSGDGNVRDRDGAGMHLLFGLSKATRLIEASLAVLGRGFQLREQPFQVQRTGEHNDALVIL